MFLGSLDLAATEKDGQWIVLRDLTWKTEKFEVTVYRGFLTDLASIPRPFRNVLDINGKSRLPSVLHDFAYASRVVSRAQADALLRDALIFKGLTAFRSWFYWAGVRLGGRFRWANTSRGLSNYDFDTLANFLRAEKKLRALAAVKKAGA